MKKQRHDDRLPFFWLLGKVVAVYNNGCSVLVEIGKVLGRRNEEFAKLLEGKTAMLEGENVKPAVKLKLDEQRGTFVTPLLDLTDGHQFVNGLEIAAHVEFSKKHIDEQSLGIFIRGWNLRQVHDPLHSQMCKTIGRLKAEEAEALRRSEREKDFPYMILEDGKLLVTDALRVLADYFEYRAFPSGEGISYQTLVKGKFVEVPIPAMLPQPNDHGTGIRIGRKPHFPELEHLLAQVQHIQPFVEGRVQQHEDEVFLHDSTDGLVGVGSAFESAEQEKNEAKASALPSEPKKKAHQGQRRNPRQRRHQEPPPKVSLELAAV